MTGEPLVIWFKITDVSVISRATPLYVRLLEERANDFLHVLGEWYEMRPDRNKVEISKQLAPGKYQLYYGVFIRAELVKETPDFTSKSCTFTVVKKI